MSGNATLVLRPPTLVVKLSLPQRSPLVLSKGDEDLQLRTMPFMVGPKGNKGNDGDTGVSEISWNSVNW